MIKKIMVFVVAFVVGGMIATGMATVVNDHTKYVHQYEFDHGVKITIDWSTYDENEDGETIYYGCINTGTSARFGYFTKAEWQNRLREYAENFEDYLTVKNVWRW